MIIKEKLADLPMGYCISLMTWGGRQYCITASEDRGGGVLLIDTETKAVQRITGLAGGVMSILPVPEQEGTFLAIQHFYPIFDSAEAEIVCCRLASPEDQTLQAAVQTVAKLPYVHRIALTGAPTARKLVAATLCHGKAYQDDWSQPGAVYEYGLDGGFQAVSHKLLLDGIHKNHGMATYQKSGGRCTLVSGEEGVWAIDDCSGVQKLCDEAVSDLCLYDIDRDGVDELICITPFHGDTMKILKQTQAGWTCMASVPLAFGHAVWAGLLGGAPAILSCGRGGDRCTRLYRPVQDGAALRLESVDIDIDVGASNVAVELQGETMVLYAANHGRNETARYTIKW